MALAIPASMGMVFNTLYNLTDIWFAGQVSDDALTGMSIAGSVFFLLIGIGAGIQTGTSAMIASDVGKKRMDDVQAWIDNAAGVACLVAVAALGIGFLIADDLIVFLGAEPDSAPLAKEYLTVTLLGNVFFVLSFVAAGALMAMGDTASNRNALAVGFVANFGLNPLLTFQFGLGVTGLALATVIIKAATSLYLFWVLKKRLGGWMWPRAQLGRWGALLKQIIPASSSMMTIILGSFITIYFIGRSGDDRVAGYSVGLRLEQVLLLPALGLNAAVMAVAGQNFGAGYPERIMETYKKALMIGLGMAVIFIPIMIFLSPSLMSVFTNRASIQETGAMYLRIDAIAFFAYVVLFLSVAVLQAIKQPIFPMVLGIARQLVVPAAINYILIIELGYPMVSVFWTIVSVVVVASVVAHWYTMRELNGLKSPIAITEANTLQT